MSIKWIDHIINNLSSSLNTSGSSKSILDNIGFQTLVAIILLIILYNIGSMIFKSLPLRVGSQKSYAQPLSK